MRKNSRSSYLFLFAIILVISGFGVAAAQSTQTTRERFVISARAGGVNAVTGRTGVHARGSSVWEQLTIKDNLQGGDVVQTGLDGRVEILLNPGSYMRVGGNSEFELVSNSLDNLEVRLVRGTAIVEATGAEDTELQINITTPHAKMAIVQRGLYRLDVVPGDLTELIVRKGRVLLTDPETKVKGGKKLIFSGRSFSVAKLTDADKKAFDSLNAWSKERAELVAKANQRMSSRDRSLLRSGFNDLWARRFGGRLGGFWLYEPAFGCYTFMPFYAGWGSPYGGSYSSSYYKGYWWKTRNSYYPTQRGYDPFPDASSPSSRNTTFGKGMGSPTSTRGSANPKTSGGKFP